MRFSQIIGHGEIVEKLRELVDSGRMPGTLLFSEQPGCGALALALATISYMFCRERSGGDSCGKCPQCVKTDKLVHPDLHFTFPLNTSVLIGKDKRAEIDEFYPLWREIAVENPYFTEQQLYRKFGIENKFGTISVSEANAIIRKLSLSSYEGGIKVMLVLFAERMNQEAANKLLKSLEEPTAGTYYFLVSQNPEKIISTILSRCMIIEVPPIERAQLAEKIAGEFGMNMEDAAIWARYAAGSYGKALELIEAENSGNEYFNTFVSLLSLSVKKDMLGLLDLGTLMAKWGKEEQKEFCLRALETLRKIYAMSIGVEEIAYSPSAEAEKLKKLSGYLKKEIYVKGYEYLNNAIVCIERNVNPKFIFCDLCNRFYYNA